MRAALATSAMAHAGSEIALVTPPTLEHAEAVTGAVQVERTAIVGGVAVVQRDDAARNPAGPRHKHEGLFVANHIEHIADARKRAEAAQTHEGGRRQIEVAARTLRERLGGCEPPVGGHFVPVGDHARLVRAGGHEEPGGEAAHLSFGCGPMGHGYKLARVELERRFFARFADGRTTRALDVIVHDAITFFDCATRKHPCAAMKRERTATLQKKHLQAIGCVTKYDDGGSRTRDSLWRRRALRHHREGAAQPARAQDFDALTTRNPCRAGVCQTGSDRWATAQKNRCDFAWHVDCTARVPMPGDHDTKRALEAALLGTAVADALGLPHEGLSAHEARVGFGDGARFRLVGKTGYVSDDTEQSALVVESVVLARGDLHESVRRFRRALCAWLMRLPFGIGWATLRACLRILFGVKQSGVRSAGNGAAMRSAVVGVLFANDDAKRRAAVRAFAEVTHRDVRAIEGALYVAELAALCVRSPKEDRGVLALRALCVVRNAELREAIEGAVLSASTCHETPSRKNTGYVVHTLEIACAAFVRAGHSYMQGVAAAIRQGGDTDTNAAIVGAWLAILHGAESVPKALVAQLAPGPFGARHLSALAYSLDEGRPPRWSRALALLRNLSLFPVVLGHGLSRPFRRLALPKARAPERVIHSGP